ncbi:MAG TPA: hypothetical protein VLB09_06875, partial [Nitrospiria bacterium]|nr:hypothetical protein [Nitrospiria bacterium]
LMPGSGGGRGSTAGNWGGAGGGALRISVLGNLTLSGEIRTNGGNGIGPHRSGGGGSGGSIFLTAGTWTGAGVLMANGGDSGGGVLAGGGGAGGRIVVICGSCPALSPSIVQAAGGSPSGGLGKPGQAGSVYIIHDLPPAGIGPEDAYILGGNGEQMGSLTAASLSSISGVGATGDPVRDRGVSFINGNITVPDITVNTGGGIGMKGDWLLSADTVTVNGELVLDADSVDPIQPFSLVQIQTLTVNPGGAVHGNGKGCGPSESYNHAAVPPLCQDLKGTGLLAGFGEGSDVSNASGGGGGGYGGAGGDGDIILAGEGAGGDAYGEPGLSSLMPGSGGGNNQLFSYKGGSGGGAVRLEVLGVLTLDGTLSADGSKGTDGANRTAGGGSGGSLHVIAGSLVGNSGVI